MQIGDNVYECKMLAFVSRNTVVRFDSKERFQVVRTFRLGTIELFHFVTDVNFRYYSEGNKVVIINPIPKKLFTREGSLFREIDTGDRIGEYKIYSATGFLNALDRNVLSL